jgi:hypothetical protein
MIEWKDMNISDLNITDEDMSENNELYSDITLQMFSAYVSGDHDTTMLYFNSLQRDYAEDEMFMPGILFAAVTHMGILMASIATATGLELEEAFKMYSNSYNNEIRQKCATMPAMQPKVARKLLQALIKRGEN